jgi:O-acetyl-ADP-ribose deacetylase (regulator of RNase III)
MRGAAATAVSIYLARSGMAAGDIRKTIAADFGYDLSMTVDQIRPGYRYNERSQDTVPQALTCAFEATDFEDAMRNAISIGGDSDTIAATAGGVAEALFGIPETMARQAWGMIPEDMQEVMIRLYGIAEIRTNAPTPPLITVVRGDIIEQRDCDGIVNSANERLRAGSGVCGVIHRAAGPELESFSQAQAPLALGQAIVTPGFALPQKAVIHVRGPKYLFDPDPARYLTMAVTNALLAADREHLTRVALPAISTGVFAYPVEEAVPILVASAMAVRARLHHVREVRFVVLDPAMQGLFRAAMGVDCHLSVSRPIE